MAASENSTLLEYVLSLIVEHTERSGGFINSCEPDFSEAFSNLFDASCLPSSFIYEVDLDSHVQSVDENASRMRQIKEELDTILKPNPELMEKIHAILDLRLRAVGFSAAEIDAMKGHAGEKVQCLLAKRQVNCPLPGSSYIVTDTGGTCIEAYVVTGIHLNGAPSQTRKITMPASTTWPDFESALSDTTATWQAEEAGYPYGYCLRHGKWLYQILQSSDNSCNFDDFEDLETAADYGSLRQKILNSSGLKLTICHEITRQLSKKRFEEYMDLRDRRSKYPNIEPVDDEGNPYFEPFFEFDSVTDADLERAGIKWG